jgi:hypothetical protein
MPGEQHGNGNRKARRAACRQSGEPAAWQDVADHDRSEEHGDEALNHARALQRMIEGVPDSDAEFGRIEQKR